MRDNFTQAFDKSKFAQAHLLIQDATSKKYALLRTPNDDNDFYSLGEDEVHVPYCQLDNSDHTLQLAKWLHDNGLSLIKLRILSSEEELSYSLADSSEGSSSNTICFHVLVDKTKGTFLVEEGQKLEWVELRKLIEVLKKFGAEPIVIAGLAQLKGEAALDA